MNFHDYDAWMFQSDESKDNLDIHEAAWRRADGPLVSPEESQWAIGPEIQRHRRIRNSLPSMHLYR